MMRRAGFTIVELLIVVVVIAILAAVTLVAYAGIRQQTNDSAAASQATQVFKLVSLEKTRAGGTNPASLTAVGVANTSTVSYDYRQLSYGICVSATQGGMTYHVSTIDQGATYGGCGQVRAEYFNDQSYSGTPAVVTYENDINLQWGTGGPGGHFTKTDQFSAHLTSYLIPTVTGDYTFYSLADDHETVRVNGVAVIDSIAGTGPCCTTETGAVTVPLTAGVAVPIDVVMREGGGGAYMRLSWSAPGLAQQYIPASAFTLLP